MTPDDDLLHSLQTLTGRPAASFRPHQREAVDALVGGRRVLLVQRTGWGKSAVYFLATHVLRRRGGGPTLLISPLLALMRNQIDAARRLGLRAETINSTNPEDFDRIVDELERDRVDLLLISPERLANPDFLDAFRRVLTRRPGLVVVDEVHCISDWGHDFRPDYRRIARILDRLVTGVPVLGCTAIANDRVVEDVAHQLGQELLVLRGPLAREGLRLHVVDLPDPAARLAWLATHVPTLPGSGIIYCLTIDDTRLVAEFLSREGLAVRAYSGDTDPQERVELEQALLENRVKALAATSALGMGFDKPDLGFVVHFQSPGSPIAYYQQVGRAGRAIAPSFGVLLRGQEDSAVQDYFIERAFPSEEETAAVLEVFDEVDGSVSMGHILARVNLGQARLELLLKQLDVDGVLRRVGGMRYERTLAPWSYPSTRVALVTAFRRAEQVQMEEYATDLECRMSFLERALDDPDPRACGGCDRCDAPTFTGRLDRSLLLDAAAFLRRRPPRLEPRLQWPFGLASPKGRIPPAERLQPGFALCRWGDGIWTPLVQRGKYGAGGRFDDEVVVGLAELVTGWAPDPAPTWVTCVPSRRHPALVPDLAARLAELLGIEFRPVLDTVRDTRPQRTQENSAQQVSNLVGAFTVVSPVPAQPVLLVDDIADSRWTLTLVGQLLLQAGSGPVYPLAAARAAGS